MEEERRLAYVGITRAEEQLYLTNAQMRTYFGRTGVNSPSRFIDEIPDELIEYLNGMPNKQPDYLSPGQKHRGVVRPQTSDHISWKAGDKAIHKKWGVGTVVSVKGEGEDLELDIAFPSPIGIKRLLAKFAPIEKQ